MRRPFNVFASPFPTDRSGTMLEHVGDAPLIAATIAKAYRSRCEMLRVIVMALLCRRRTVAVLRGGTSGR
jgi:hypothetical protein